MTETIHQIFITNASTKTKALLIAAVLFAISQKTFAS
jgi:hypothetical protein